MAAISRLPLTASKEWRPRLKWVARILMPSNVNFAHPESDDVRRAYVHAAEYWLERVKMIQAWADYLDELRDAGRVIPLRRENA